MFNKKRVAILLSQGISQAKVATIVGCAPALITQKLSTDPKLEDNEFKDLVTAAEAEVGKLDAEAVAIEAKYTQAEHALLDQVLVMAPAGELREVTAALRVIADRKNMVNRQVPASDQVGSAAHTVVVLQMPGHIQTYEKPVIDITPTKEVIAIGSQNLQPLDSKAVTKLFKKLSHTNELDTNSMEIEHDSSGNAQSTDSSSKKALPKLIKTMPIKSSFLQSEKTFAEC